MDWLELIGRLMFVAMFLNSGYAHFKERENMIGYARMKGAPAPRLLVPATGAMLLAGGLLIGIGVWMDLGAVLIAAFLLPTAYFMHAYWKVDDPQARAGEHAHFFKNLSLAGAALTMVYFFVECAGHVGLTAGPVSLF